MSGIVGSRLNIRGSGLVGGLGTDGQVLTSAGAGQEMIFESLTSAAITAINNPTANELVTVGSTTTELDAESGLTYTDGALVIGGTTPSLTIGDAGAEDTKIVFDGNAQDFHIGLDDTADDLVIGKGSALGTTPAIAIDENLKVNIPVTTASTSASTGSLTTGGGAGIGADLYVGDDTYLITDSAVLGFGADKDTTLTHTDGTGLTLNSTNKLCFNDASQFVQGSSATVLSLGATDEIDLTATAIDINGTCDISGTFSLGGTNITTTAAEINLIDGGTSRGTTAVASGDGILINDAGTMAMTNVDTVSTYFAGHSVGGSNIVTVGTIGTGVWQGTAIASGYIAADAITGAKIADDAIDSEHYADGSIDNAHIADDAIDSEHYADGSIDNAHIADDAIDSEHYADGSIDNAHIADDAIDSEHYAAGSIDTAHIADNQVTLAKMAGGTDGNIISFDASGDPVAIATGSDGQVLTSTGAGSPPAFEAAGGGDYVQVAGIQGETATSAITFNGCFTTSYKAFMVMYNCGMTAESYARFQFVDTSDNVLSASSYSNSGIGAQSGSASSDTSSDNTSTGIEINAARNTDDDDTRSIFSTIHFGDVAGESDHWPGGVCLTHYGKDSVAAFAVNGGKYKVATAVGGLKFSMASGNIENFNIQIYGMKGTTS